MGTPVSYIALGNGSQDVCERADGLIWERMGKKALELLFTMAAEKNLLPAVGGLDLV